jgi:hypothetical protein
MYAIYGNIYHQYTPNVSIKLYTIHGSYGKSIMIIMKLVHQHPLGSHEVFAAAADSWRTKDWQRTHRPPIKRPRQGPTTTVNHLPVWQQQCMGGLFKTHLSCTVTTWLQQLQQLRFSASAMNFWTVQHVCDTSNHNTKPCTIWPVPNSSHHAVRCLLGRRTSDPMLSHVDWHRN